MWIDGETLARGRGGNSLRGAGSSGAGLESERSLVSLVDAVSDAVVLLDRAGKVAMLSRTAHSLFGWTSAEAAGSPVRSLLPGIQWADVLRAADADDGGVRTTEAVTRIGAAFTVDVKTVSIEAAGANWVGLVINEAGEAPGAALHRIEASATLVAALANDLSHVLEAVGIIGGMLQRRTRADSNSAVQLGQLSSIVDKGGVLVRALLRVAASAGRDPEISAIDVDDLLEQSKPLLSLLAGRGIFITVDPGRGDRRALGDATLLELVLVNLIVSARDAMRGLGRIRLSTDCARVDAVDGTDLIPGEYVVIRVADDGPGVDPIYRRTLLSFASRNGDGNGLGLWSARNVLQQLGGDIVMESSPNGTSFYLYLRRNGDLGV